jgi:NADH:ubiquinone oxidoreductase subunit 2 (subunit N)
LYDLSAFAGGYPLTGGFFAKYYMLASVVSTGKWMWLVMFAVLCAAVSVYYYFRVIQAMYFKDGDGATELAPGAGFKGMLVLLAALVVLVGGLAAGIIAEPIAAFCLYVVGVFSLYCLFTTMTGLLT